MKYGEIKGIDTPVSRLIQGTMMFRKDDLDWTFGLLDDIYAAGCNTFDMAHGYCGGDSERLLGQWLRERDLRDKVVVFTKGCHHNGDRKRVTPFDLASDLYDSRARLRVETIDLYVLHRDDSEVEVGPIVESLNEQLAAGRIRAFGGSNWSHERIAEANAYADAHGLVPFAVSSPNFSLAEMVEPAWGGCTSISGPGNEAARAWYAERNMPLLTWSSLARGFFAGNISRDNLDKLDGPNRSSIRSYCHEQNFQRLDRVEILAKEKGLSVAQIATAYVASQPLNIFALIGCYSGAEFRECVEACDTELTPEEIAWLDLRGERA